MRVYLFERWVAHGENTRDVWGQGRGRQFGEGLEVSGKQFYEITAHGAGVEIPIEEGSLETVGRVLNAL